MWLCNPSCFLFFYKYPASHRPCAEVLLKPDQRIKKFKKLKTFHSQSFSLAVAAQRRADGEQNESQHKAGTCVEENKVAEFSGAVPRRADNILFRRLRALRESRAGSESS